MCRVKGNDMKKAVCILLSMLSVSWGLSCYAQAVPEPDYASLLRGVEAPYEILQTVGAGENSGRVFLLLQQGSLYRICILEYGGDGWRLALQSSLIPKRGGVIPQIHIGTWGKTEDILYISIFYLTYYDNITPRTDDNIVSHADYSFYKATDGSWQMGDCSEDNHIGDSVRYGGAAFLYPYEIRLSGAFAPGAPYEHYRFFGMLDRDLRSFSIDDIPLSPQDAQRMLDTENLAMVNNPDPAEGLPLRTSPSEDGPFLGKYYNGALAKILEYTDSEWTKVDILGVEGYMTRKCLVLSDQYDSVEKAFTQRFPDAGFDLPLYQNPDDSSAIVAYVPPGFEVFQWGVTENGWSHVLYDNIGGYMQSVHLEEDLSWMR